MLRYYFKSVRSRVITTMGKDEGKANRQRTWNNIPISAKSFGLLLLFLSLSSSSPGWDPGRIISINERYTKILFSISVRCNVTATLFRSHSTLLRSVFISLFLVTNPCYRGIPNSLHCWPLPVTDLRTLLGIIGKERTCGAVRLLCITMSLTFRRISMENQITSLLRSLSILSFNYSLSLCYNSSGGTDSSLSYFLSHGVENSSPIKGISPWFVKSPAKENNNSLAGAIVNAWRG